MPTAIFPLASEADDGAGFFRDAFYPPTTFTNNDAATAVGPARVFSSPNYTVANWLFRWDTSSIPDDGKIWGAELRVDYITFNGGSKLMDIIGDWFAWGGEPTVAADITVDETFDAISPVDWSAWIAGIQVLPIADLSGISKSGFTELRLKLVDNVAPVGINAPDFASHEHATLAAAELRVMYDLNRPMDASQFPKANVRPSVPVRY